MFELPLKYLWHHKIMSSVAAYFAVSLLLLKFFSIDITIPCLWRAIWGVRCPGCGLTSAFVELIGFNFPGAYEANPLVFLVIPAGGYYIVSDFLKFKSRLREQTLTKQDTPHIA